MSRRLALAIVAALSGTASATPGAPAARAGAEATLRMRAPATHAIATAAPRPPAAATHASASAIATADDAGAPTMTAPTTPTTPVPPATPATPTTNNPAPPAGTSGSTPTTNNPATPTGTSGSTATSTSTAPAGDTAAPTGNTSAPTTTAATTTNDTSTSTTATAPEAPPDLSDQAIGAEVGAASGGRDTPGGVRVAGHYLYQLAAKDWFDGLAAFTFGGGGAACFRDRMNVFLCDHGIADGGSVEIAATVRHFFASPVVGGKSGQFWPFLLGGIGIRVDRFSADDVTGLAIPLHLGAGMRVSVTSSVAITAQGQLELGFGAFNHTLGLEPQLGAALTAGAEFRL